MRPTPFFWVIAVAIMLSACSQSETSGVVDDSTTTSVTAATTTTLGATTTLPSAFPVTIDASNGSVVIDAMPERIVSISPTSTEILFAVGAGPQVIAVDDRSDFPQESPMTDLSAYAPNIEAIASFDPDLVFVSYDPTGDLLPSLEALGIPAILHSAPATVAEAYAQWEQVGAATGHLAEAEGVVAETMASIASAYGELGENSASLSYYYELDDTYYSVTSTSFIGDLFSGSMMTNIADPADEEGFGYPQLTSEYIVETNPDVILLADTQCCGQSTETLASRPGWDAIDAVASGFVVELDDDVASRWGPRIAVLVDAVVAAILDVESANT